MEKIKAFLDPDYKFSTRYSTPRSCADNVFSRCRDVLAPAREEYYRDLPEHYTTEFHNNKVSPFLFITSRCFRSRECD